MQNTSKQRRLMKFRFRFCRTRRRSSPVVVDGLLPFWIPHFFAAVHAWKISTKGLTPMGGSDNADSATTASSAQSSSRHKESKKKGKAPMLDGPAYSGHNIPGSSPAPHLSLANVQSIGTGFCKMQMQPGAVSGEVLQAPINEDIDNYLCLARLDVSLLIILVVTFDSLAAPLFSSSTVLSGRFQGQNRNPSADPPAPSPPASLGATVKVDV
jgi:hypothetical protein